MSENVISFPHHRSSARFDTEYESGRLRLIRHAAIAATEAKLWQETNPELARLRYRDCRTLWNMVEALRLAHAS